MNARASGTHPITYKDAITLAMREVMTEDAKIFMLGQDIGRASMLGMTKGFADEFGLDRIRDCPISESAMIGMAVGAAMKGHTAIIELAYADILAVAFSSIVHSAAKISYATNGRHASPLMIRAPIGRWSRHGPMGTDIAASWFYNVPDINIAMPATASEAYGSFRHLIKSPYPTIFLEDKSLYPAEELMAVEPDPMQARIVRPGTELSIFAAGRTVGVAIAAADLLSDSGRPAPVEIISLGLVKPLDRATLLASARRTGRVLILQDEPPLGGYGPAIQSLLCGAGAPPLAVPPRLLARPDSFLPYNREEDHLPTAAQVRDAIVDLLQTR